MTELSAEVSPNFIPKIAATRSKCATLTRPQFSPPTTRSTAAITSSVFIFSSIYLILGRSTVSITWITPLEAKTSALHDLGVIDHGGAVIHRQFQVLAINGFRRI